MPLPTLYTTFVPDFLNRIWQGAARVRIADRPPDQPLRNHALRPQDAIAMLLTMNGTPNLWFTAAALNETGYAKRDCRQTLSICVDVDLHQLQHGIEGY